MRIFGTLLLMWAGIHTPALAQTQAQKDDAKWILERLTGIKWPSDSPVLRQAVNLVMANNRAGVAALATSQPQFLNVTVKNFGLKMSNREESIRVPLNDFTATIMGVTRDETDARELLFGNFFYMGPAMVGTTTIPSDLYSHVLISNVHYDSLDNRRIDIGAVLTRQNGQRLVQTFRNTDDGVTEVLVPNPDPGGVLTSRAWFEAHVSAGTNRRPIEYTFREFLCIPIEKWADAASSDVRIGRDIDRFPGGEHIKFQTSCKACHTGMDGFRGAWAKWEFENNTMLQTTVRRGGGADGNNIVAKMNRNNTVYPGGYVTTDDSWVNNAVRGVNLQTFGWRGLDGRNPASSGTGINTFGRLVANSQRFSTCMAKRAFESVCKKELPVEELAALQALGSQFEGTNYNLKKLFQMVALHPRCK